MTTHARKRPPELEAPEWYARVHLETQLWRYGCTCPVCQMLRMHARLGAILEHHKANKGEKS